MLNFAERTGSGALTLIWPMVIVCEFCSICTILVVESVSFVLVLFEEKNVFCLNFSLKFFGKEGERERKEEKAGWFSGGGSY